MNILNTLVKLTNAEQMISIYLINMATLFLFTWFATQLFKLLLKWIVGKEKITFSTLFADGDFPSTHTATHICVLFISFFELLFSANFEAEISNNFFRAVMLTMLTLYVFTTLRDAVGHRHRQDNTNANLLALAEEIDKFAVSNRISENLKLNIRSEKLKRVGHLKPEMYGGIISGVIGASYVLVPFVDFKLFFICLLFSVIYTGGGILLSRKRKSKLDAK